MGEKDLQRALIGAAESPPGRRDEWVDPVAGHGEAGIDAVIEWIHDPDLAPFAFDVIVRAAQLGSRAHALEVMGDVLRRQLDTDRIVRLTRSIDQVSAIPEPASQPFLSQPQTYKPMLRTPTPKATRPLPLAKLLAGEEYRRRDELHASGLGADIFKGISYAKDGDHVLLFTGGHGADEFGYEDGWDGPFYRYYGEFRNSGDMQMIAGNRAIIDRSPHIYLFTQTRKSFYRFEGRFEYIDHKWTTLPFRGRDARAIIFRLLKIADVVEL